MKFVIVNGLLESNEKLHSLLKGQYEWMKDKYMNIKLKEPTYFISVCINNLKYSLDSKLCKKYLDMYERLNVGNISLYYPIYPWDNMIVNCPGSQYYIESIEFNIHRKEIHGVVHVIWNHANYRKKLFYKILVRYGRPIVLFIFRNTKIVVCKEFTRINGTVPVHNFKSKSKSEKWKILQSISDRYNFYLQDILPSIPRILMVCKNHRICKMCAGKSAACTIVISSGSIILGLERSGRNKGKYNICCGSMDVKDKQCYVNLARRELAEEFKLNFDAALKYTAIGNFIIPVFIVYFKNLNLDLANEKITKDLKDDDLPDHEKEIDHLKAFSMSDKYKSILSPEDNSIPISKFAKRVISNFIAEKNYY